MSNAAPSPPLINARGEGTEIPRREPPEGDMLRAARDSCRMQIYKGQGSEVHQF